ncbi:MAG: DUF3833 domain-containing protein [Geminicoccaceae bacterium]|jgi:hypothetical protein|nr:DUF3833 domain-containing protein [Geminicoccaceae bacterium]MCB9968623.1 DUF3833 domain-containing protein [Geminicoccaceae bacterium]HRY23179.1 DUF3833 domain-containing protein [Geminicoccaceae bacterium]
MIRTVLAAVMLCVIAGCTAMKIDDFDGTAPAFVPEDYFLGETRAWGLFQDRFGTVRREFVVDIEGRMEGDVLVLDEAFRYADGERDQRTWHIRPLGDGRYEGEADDIVGTATGVREGKAMRWTYLFDLAVGDRIWRVSFDDWMFLQDETVMINRTTVSKWGFTLGEVYIFFKKPELSGAVGETAAQASQDAAQ